MTKLRYAIQIASRRHLTRRAFSSSTIPPLGVDKHRSKAAPAPPVRFDPDYEPPVTDVEVPFETHVKNAALATAIVAFCCGVFWYSMHAVGQAGSGGSDDPLAGLKQEAELARGKLERETRTAKEAKEMLKQFEAGGYDPDKEKDLDEKQSKRERPWWKFW